MDRIAQWVDLGTLPYQEAYQIQNDAYQARRDETIPDTIFSAEHPLEVNFGTNRHQNQFSDQFLQDVKASYGSFEEDKVLAELEKRGILFSKTKRGGGATVIAPGQYVFYPIVNHERITGRSYGVVDYKRIIDEVLHSVISHYDVPNLEIASGIIVTKDGKRDMRDVWTTVNGKSFKIGSKGLIIDPRFASHGFVIYALHEGVDPFNLVHACGYRHDEVGVTSIEDVVGTRPERGEVIDFTKVEIKDRFKYNHIEEISLEELLEQMS